MAGEPTLKRGHSNPHQWVVYAQQMLNHALGGGMHIDVPENGVFDAEFEHEVSGFQGRVGLAQSGEVDHDTWAALHRAAEGRQQQAQADADDEQAQAEHNLRTPATEVHNAPGHRDDNTFHTRPDGHGHTDRVYDVDAEHIHAAPGGHTDFNSVVATMVNRAQTNVGMQIPYVLSGIEQFHQSSAGQIAGFVAGAQHFEESIHVEFPWGLLVDGLDHALDLALEVEGPWASWAYEKVKGAFVHALTAELESHASQVPGLQAKLEAGVNALVDHANHQARTTVDDIQATIPEYIAERMQEHQQVTNDDQWIGEMVRYFGFPMASEASVTQPILHTLNTQFGAMIHAAQEELVRNA